MPKDFAKCQAAGGRIRTKKLPGGKYMHICWDKNGKSHAGEIKTTKSTKKKMGFKK